MRNKIVAVATLVAVVVAPALVAADMPSLTAVSCASSAAPVKITSRVPASAASAKVYFKAAGQQSEYYVDMRRAADGSMWAFIPSPLDTTKSFSYRVISMDAKNVQASSQLMTATTAASCAPQNLSANEQRVASNMVIGMTVPGQPVVPTGFQCRGVVSYISSGGEMRPNDECRRIAALGPQSGATTANGTAATGSTSANGASATSGSASSTAGSTAGGSTAAGSTAAAAGSTAGGAALSTGTIIAITAGALAAGVIIYHNNHNKNNTPVSPSRP